MSTRLLFVGGAARSGTTLVQNILDSHPEVCGGPEFFCVLDVVRLRQRLHSLIGKGWIDFYCSREEVDELLARLVEDFFRRAALRNGCRILSEKSPDNVLVLPELVELLPEHRFIHVVRDPRATIASLLGVGARARKKGTSGGARTRSVAGAVRYVRECLDAGFEASRRHPERVLTVVYEELVRDPVTETKRWCAFLDLEWSARMLHPSRFQHPGEAPIVNDVWYTKEMFHRDPSAVEIAKWKSQLSAVQQARITAAFMHDRELARLGYDLSPESVSPLARALGASYARAGQLGARARAWSDRLRDLARPARRRIASLTGR